MPSTTKWWLDKKGDCSSSSRSSRSRRSRRRAASAMRRNSRWAGDQKLPNAILHFQILPYCRFWRSNHSREKVYWHCWWDNWLSSLVEKQANEGTKENSNHVRCDPDQDPSTPFCLGLIKCSADDFQVIRWHRLHFCSIWTQRWLHIASSGNVGTSQFALSSILVKGESWCNLVFNDNSCWENLTLEPKDP